MSLFHQVERLATLARFVAGSLALTMGLRVALVAWSAEAPPPRPATSSPEAARSAPARPTSSAQKAPRLLRVHLTVDVGDDRSDVLIDGARRGQIPFVGDITCQEGAPILIEVHGKSSVKKLERTCDRAILQVR